MVKNGSDNEVEWENCMWTKQRTKEKKKNGGKESLKVVHVTYFSK